MRQPRPEWVRRGSTSSHSRCRPHALLRKPRAPSHQHPHPAASRPPLTQGLPTPDGSTGPAVAPTHGRRRVPAKSPLRSPTMGRRYRFPFFIRGGRPRNLSGAGRWGWAGALSAMDGAKRGTHGRSFCRPPTSPTARPQARNPLFAAAHREGVSPVRPPERRAKKKPLANQRLLQNSVKKEVITSWLLQQRPWPARRCLRQPWQRRQRRQQQRRWQRQQPDQQRRPKRQQR